MAGQGFIHDKLELKFLILYIAARVIEPIPFDTMLDLTMCDDAVDYFDFTECLRDLVDTEHLTLSQDGLYSITEKPIGGTYSLETVAFDAQKWRSGTGAYYFCDCTSLRSAQGEWGEYQVGAHAIS